MSDGIKWAYEQREAEEKYKKHISSRTFNKEYLESDIVRSLTKEELHLLVTRLIIHQLGGFAKYFEKESSAKYDLFKQMTKKAQISFVKNWAVQLGLELSPSKKLDKLRVKIEEMKNIMYIRSEE